MRHSATWFDFDKVCPEDSATASAADEQKLADDLVKAIFVSVISFIFEFCFAQTRTLECAFRRFVALGYIVRPDLIGDKSQRNLAGELKVARSEVARHVKFVRDGLELEGHARLMTAKGRANVRLGQVRARAARLHQRPRATGKGAPA